MIAEQFIKDGSPNEALKTLQAEIRKNPANPKLRIFLFQLLAVLGEWERAFTQLNLTGDLDAATLPMVQTYREAIRCEILRKEIFSGQKMPLFFGEPEQWIALLVESLKLTAQQQYADAESLRIPAFSGSTRERSTAVLGIPASCTMRPSTRCGRRASHGRSTRGRQVDGWR